MRLGGLNGIMFFIIKPHFSHQFQPIAGRAPRWDRERCQRLSQSRRTRHTGSLLIMNPKLSHEPLLLGMDCSRAGTAIHLAAEERRRYVFGQTDTGKSTLLLNLIQQDLVSREGLAVLDPHGCLAEAVLRYIPKSRINALVYLNPADLERPIGFNPLSNVRRKASLRSRIFAIASFVAFAIIRALEDVRVPGGIRTWLFYGSKLPLDDGL